MILYVDACARKDGDGSKDSPFRRIGQAARIARPGDEILVSPAFIMKRSILFMPEHSKKESHTARPFPGRTSCLTRTITENHAKRR